MKEYNEPEYFWTNGNTIIFKSNFNCYETIKKEGIYNINFNNVFKKSTENKDKNSANSKCYIGTDFLNNFDDKIKLSEELEIVKFGLNFNQKIELPKKLKSVIFGHDFNQKLELPKGLKTIEFCNSNLNSKLELPKRLKTIKFVWDFNEKIKLPKELKSIEFGNRFNQKIELPEKLKSVKFYGNKFNQKIELPSGLKSIIFNYSFREKIKLPEGLKSVEFGLCFDIKIKLPIKLKVISICRKFKLNLLSNNLEKININCYHGINKNINYITNKIKKVCILDNKIKLKNLVNSVKLIVLQNERGKNILRKFDLRIKIDSIK